MYFIETREVVKQFSGHLALNRVSISVPRGRIFGLLGPNGAGKTTLIRQSDVFRIGYMPEERGLYRKMKVGEQAIYLAQLKGLTYAEARKRLQTWFQKFEIESWWNRKLEELSKGMQQKVQFIITVIHDPDLLIFDEPFSGFDPINADRLKQEIIELKNAGKTIIFSTHNMASVEEICDEIALIDQSQVVLSGQVREIRRRYKTNTFTVQIPLDDNPLIAPNVPFEIVERRNLQDATELRIRKPQEFSNSELLAAIAREFEILSFTEEFPSMNEVFINTVSGKKSQ